MMMKLGHRRVGACLHLLLLILRECICFKLDGSFHIHPAWIRRKPQLHRPAPLRRLCLQPTLESTAHRKGRTQRCLFFQQTADEASAAWISSESTDETARYWKKVYRDLASPQVTFPYRVEPPSDPSTPPEDAASTVATVSPRVKYPNEVVTIRPLQRKDVKEVTEICVEEYSRPLTARDAWWKPATLDKWIDRIGLRIQVELTMLMKARPVSPDKFPSLSLIPPDHVVLVASMEDHIVGMVEISQQPVLPTHNPSPMMIPLPWKRLFAERLAKVPVQGWVANMLVIRSCRGKGLSKLLMAGVEGVARTWQCSSIHLHCDADATNGLVSQRLYQGLGYQTVSQVQQQQQQQRLLRRNEDQDMANFEWLQNTLHSSVVFVNGIPLLYLRKQL